MNSSSNTFTRLLCEDHSKILIVDSRIHPKIIKAREYYCSCSMENPNLHLQELGYSNFFDSFMVIPLTDIALEVMKEEHTSRDNLIFSVLTPSCWA